VNRARNFVRICRRIEFQNDRISSNVVLLNGKGVGRLYSISRIRPIHCRLVVRVLLFYARRELRYELTVVGVSFSLYLNIFIVVNFPVRLCNGVYM